MHCRGKAARRQTPLATPAQALFKKRAVLLLTFPSLERPYWIYNTRKEKKVHHLTVSDMTCGHCATAVEKAAKSVDPAASVFVDLDSSSVSIDSTVPTETFVTALQGAGYASVARKQCCGSAL